MPDKEERRTRERARRDLRQGKRPSTAAGEFVHEEIEHVRRGRHGARSTKQAIAIGLSKARRAGVPLKPPRKGQAKKRTRQSAERAYEAGRKRQVGRPAPKRSRAVTRALKREPRSTASPSALSRQARSAARRRSPRARSAAARKGARTRAR